MRGKGRAGREGEPGDRAYSFRIRVVTISPPSPLATG